MKKSLPVIMSLAALCFFACGTAQAAQVYTLYAGQTIDVGTVTVSNGADYLYVTYNLTGGWELVETHVHVATSPGDIPQTKKGNPIPGQFEYSEPPSDPQTQTYTIDLDWAAGAALYIAAHAVVVKETATELVANDGFEVPTLSGSWGIVPLLDPSLAWTVAPAIPPWDDPPQVPGLELQAIWTPHSGSQYAELDAYDPVRISQSIGPCASGLYTLRYAWSPRPGVSENEMEVYWNGGLIATHSADGTGNSDTSWTQETFANIHGPSGVPSLLEFVETGPHDQLGMFLDSISMVCVQEESAWADGQDFSGANWATYISYVVRTAELIPCTINYPGPSYPPGGGYVIFKDLGGVNNLGVTVVLEDVLASTEYDIYLGVDIWGTPGKVGTIMTDAGGDYTFSTSVPVSIGTHTLNIDIVLKGTGADIYELPGIHDSPMGGVSMTFD